MISSRASIDLAVFRWHALHDFLGNEGPEQVVHAYRPDIYRRLATVKDMYAPTDSFQLNQNIAPVRGE
jgi:hypothetical protein